MLKPENLKPDQVLLCKVLPTKSSKVQLEFAELIPGTGNIVSMLNAADARFNKFAQKPVRAWISVEIENAKEYFPDIIEALDKVDEEQREINVAILNPTMDHLPVKILITERTGQQLSDEYAITTSQNRKEAISYLTDNYLTTAKRAGKGGVFLVRDGSPIFRETSLTFSKAEHTFIKHNNIAEYLEEITPGIELVPSIEETELETINH